MAHMIKNISAADVRFPSTEIAELKGAVSAVQVRGARLPEQVLVYSGAEAPRRTEAGRTWCVVLQRFASELCRLELTAIQHGALSLRHQIESVR